VFYFFFTAILALESGQESVFFDRPPFVIFGTAGHRKTMVTLFNPSTSRTPPKNHSDITVTDHEVRSCFVMNLFDENRATSFTW
jgi:hypothetical protein